MIGFVGLSHLGLVSSIAAASRGFPVVAYDANENLCAALNRGELPIHEPDLPELLGAARDTITFTADPGALSKCDVIYFSLDVPTDQHNQSDLRPLQALIENIAPQAPANGTLVILSQVCPGFTRRMAEQLHAAHPGKNWQIHYQVETLIFGRAVERALHPERYIIGCADAHQSLPTAFSELLQAFDCPILPMRYESAELSKISINFCLVASVSVANTLAELCEAIGADWSEIVPTLKLDRRIGPHAYLSPGLGISGGNLERDLATVKKLANEWGTDAGIVDAWLTNSEHRRNWVLRKIHEASAVSAPNGAKVSSLGRQPQEGSTGNLQAPKGRQSRIAVWGLAYKPGTRSIKNSPALALLQDLASYDVRAFDPQVAVPVEQFENFAQAHDALHACDQADVLVVMTPWPEFAAVSLAQVAEKMRGRTVIDPFALFSSAECRKHGLVHHRCGAGS